MNVNVIGAGHLGKNLALAFLHNKACKTLTLCNQTDASTKAACTAIGGGEAVKTIHDLPCAEVTFITTPDDVIAAVVAKLAENNALQPGYIFAHCSGALDSNVLKPLQEKGCLVASIHPLKAFPHVNEKAFNDCFCVAEGDKTAVAVLSALFMQIGAQVLSLPTFKNRGLYHAAAVMASNYVVTLAACAEDLLFQAGLESAHAKAVTQQLMQNSLHNLQNATKTSDALTGPLARGDKKTISQHLKALEKSDILKLYRAAGVATLPLTTLDENTITSLKQQLLAAD